MTTNPTALTPHDAAKALLWLAEMGADEGFSETPVNRFAERAAPPTPKPLPAAATSTPAPPPKREVQAFDAAIETIHATARAAASLDELKSVLGTFDAHPLKRSASKLCFTSGAKSARILLLVDRPRSEEDRAGLPLADKHALLAERMLAAIGLRAEDEGAGEQVSLLTFLPWRPPGNRSPTELECRLIMPFAECAIALLQPKLILAFGALPGQWLAQGDESLPRQRGKWLDIGGIPFLSTFHPETLLKSPAQKRLAWQDLLAFKERLDRLP